MTSMQRMTKKMKKTIKIVRRRFMNVELTITTPCDAYMAVSRVRRGLGVRDGEVTPLHLMIFFFGNRCWEFLNNAEECLNNVVSYC